MLSLIHILNISVNVFGYESESNEFGYRKDEVYPIWITEHKGRTHVNLLLLVNYEGVKHYCLIGNMSRLLNTLTKSKSSSFYCNYCLQRFRDNTDPEMARK